MITIVDYGIGNLSSIQNMLKKIGVPSQITSHEMDIKASEKLILPGVGAFDTCAAKLEESGLRNILNDKVLNGKIPVLGVCVGMQLLTEGSEEGRLSGLGWIKGRTIKFDQNLLGGNLKVPHMGWSDVIPVKPSRLFDGMEKTPRFYFVHSYYPRVSNPDDVLATAHYGHEFTCAMENGNIAGVQFHPEKSHKFGMKLLDNFAKNY